MACPALGLVGVLVVAVALQPLMWVLVERSGFTMKWLLAFVPRQRAASAPTPTPAAVCPCHHFFGALHSYFRGGVVELLVLIAEAGGFLFHPDICFRQVPDDGVVGRDQPDFLQSLVKALYLRQQGLCQ